MMSTWRALPIPAATILAVLGAACADQPATVTAPEATAAMSVTGSTADLVRILAADRGIVPMPPSPAVRPSLVRLGRALVFDPILAGDRDIACMTCHAPRFGTGDGRHLAVGQGATGIGPDRVHPDGRFIARNAPPLFNLHVLDAFFWDGSISADSDGRIRVRTPAGPQLTADMEAVFEFGALSAVALLPVLSREEMRGFTGNELARVPDGQPQRVWRGLMRRLGAVPEYRRLFEAAYPGTPFARMSFAHASNAMAGFLVQELAFDDSPWDRFLAGDDAALTADELEGARIFMEIRCSICHNGPAFTDRGFHNVALAQFGPGHGDGPDGSDDFGRGRVSGDPADRYAFRTTPLRNVELTGPYGHAGQFADLREFIDHYSESDEKLHNYDVTQLEPALRPTLLDNADAILATRDPVIDGVVLPADMVDALATFMRALSDPAALDLESLIPDRVPSGLPPPR